MKLSHNFNIVNTDIKNYEHYIVFSKTVDKKLMNQVNSSIRKLKAEGKWQKVVSRYLDLN